MTFAKILTIALTAGFMLFAAELKSQEQNLKPGFDKAEYKDMLLMAACSVDTPWVNSKLVPLKFRLLYRSAVTGLDNRWDLWVNEGNVAVISIRGTTGTSESWLENFYAAMVPANGSMKLSANRTFDYKLADNPKAAVHVGWLMATGFLAEDVISKIDSCYRRGIWDFIITGHSQGGGISYLMTAYLLNLQKTGALPADIRFKTYCSAAPKPGNLYFAYDFENMTSGGWAFNVVNTADWVPETPLSIQTIDDFNTLNPFVNAKRTLKKQSFPTRIAMSYAYGRLDRPTRRAVKNYRKYLGTVAGKYVGKSLPDYQAPEYLYANHYVRTGTTIVLYADKMYYENYPDNPENVFVHHLAGPYLYLLRMLKE